MRRIGLIIQQVRGGQDHPRRTDAALRSSAFQKSLLQIASSWAPAASPSMVTMFASLA